MRDDRQEERSERDMPDKQKKTVRFASVITTAGKPEAYLPLSDPKQDRSFMRAVRENRVLSIRQEPTSTRADFGIAGFDERKFTTHLIFPKPLTAFNGVRIVGIKYDVVGSSPVVASTGRHGAEKSKTKVTRRAATAAREPARRAETKPAKPPKPAAPQPKGFRVQLRITTVIEKEVTVSAMTKNEAKKKAQAVVAGGGGVRVVSVAEI